MLLPGSLIVIGGVGLVGALLRSSTSTERRAALASQTRAELFEASARLESDYPSIPSLAEIVDSPGTRLAYRLPIDVSSGWRLAGTLAACIVWNAIVAVFAAIAIRDAVAATPDWMMTAFLIPFATGGVALIWITARRLLVTTKVGPTTLEISGHPLQPGESYEVLMTQTGRLKYQSLTVSLVCEEVACFSQGTNTRTERRRVHESRVYSRESFVVQAGVPFEDIFMVRIPSDAMHSFESEHNELQWKLIVDGVVAGGPNYNRDYPIVVYPQRQELAA